MCDLHNSQTEAELIGETEQGFKVASLSRRDLIRGVAAGTMLAAVPALSACTTNPETGSSQFILVSESQLVQMAAASWTDVKKQEKTLVGTSYNRKLEAIGQKIAVASGRGNQKWEYAVFDSETKNAFVMPGNKVGFYKGIMDFSENDDQVAGILGHEVGHVTGRHAAERISQQMAGQVAVIGGTMLGASQYSKRCNQMKEQYAAGGYTAAERNEINKCYANANRNTQMTQAALGAGLMVGIILPYSRKHELQADVLGAKYMHKAGYDPRQAARLWDKMARENNNRVPSFLSTHPDPTYRAENLRRYIAEQGW
ncbi:MAG: M48 family metallopeptidase [bacterium]